MTNEQVLAQTVLDLQRENDELRTNNHDLRELLEASTLEVAQMSERVDFLFLVLAKVSASTPAVSVADQFPSLIPERVL